MRNEPWYSGELMRYYHDWIFYKYEEEIFDFTQERDLDDDIGGKAEELGLNLTGDTADVKSSDIVVVDEELDDNLADDLDDDLDLDETENADDLMKEIMGFEAGDDSDDLSDE